LIVWYVDILDNISKTYSANDETTTLNILAAPMDIRGYSPVRKQEADTVREEVGKLSLR